MQVKSKNKMIYIVMTVVLLVIVLTAATAVIGWLHLDATSDKLKRTAEDFQNKTELLITMWDKARARTISLQSMIFEDDDFERDEVYIRHLAHGSEFLLAYENLKSMEISDKEKDIMKDFVETLAIAGPTQERLVELALNDHQGQALEEMRKPYYISIRQELFEKFKRILDFYRNITHQAVDDVNNIVLKEIKLILTLTAVVLLLSATVGFFMIRKVSKIEKNLLIEVERNVQSQADLSKHHQELKEKVKYEVNKYKKTEEERGKSQRMAATFGKILEDSINEIYIFDAETLKFIQANHGARKNLGYSQKEIQELTPLDLKKDLSKEEFNKHLQPLREGSKKHITFKSFHTRKDTTKYPVEVHLQLSTMDSSLIYVAMILDITKRVAAENKLILKSEEMENAKNELQLQKLALDEHAIVSVVSKNETLTHVNEKFTEISQFTEEELLGGHFCIGMSDDQPEEFFIELSSTIQNGKPWHGIICSNRKDGTPYWTNTTITPFINNDNEIYKFVVISTDFTAEKMAERQLLAKTKEIEAAHEELKSTRSQAQQAEKLASVGQLAAGIAHEINTPIQFVGDNARFLQEAFEDISGLIEAYETLCATAKDNKPIEDLLKKAQELSDEIDIEYINEEIPNAITQSLEGVDRVTKIVRSMKDFSHPGSEHKEVIDLNNAIDSTITVSRNEWKYEAELVTDFDTSLTAVPCYPGEFNQVILNMIVNASHAIKDSRGESGEMGTITIKTKLDNDYAEVQIKDSGTGMPEDVRLRIFEPFYTTKGVGKGSGQGLAIAYAVVVDKHHGTIDVESEPGQGTTFIIRLPIKEIEETKTNLDETTSNSQENNTAYG